MEQHLQTLKESHGWPEYLEYRNTAIDKPFITKGKTTIHHQLFFPEDKLEMFKDRYISYTYNGRDYNDVKIAEIEDKVIKTSKGYTFARSKISELHMCCREYLDTHKIETRNFIESPKV